MPIKTRIHQCYLCGSDKELDEDHVFAKAIYPLKDPIKLMICRKDNNEVKSMMDESVGLWMNATGKTTAAQAYYRKKLSRLNEFKGSQGNYKAKKLARHITDHRQIPIFDKQGVFSMKNAIRTDSTRLRQYVLMIIKGLLTHHKGKIFNWDEFHKSVVFKPIISRSTERAELDTLLAKLYMTTKQNPDYSGVWEGIFEYYVHEAVDGSTDWFLLFFNTHSAVGKLIKVGSVSDTREKNLYGANYYKRKWIWFD